LNWLPHWAMDPDWQHLASPAYWIVFTAAFLAAAQWESARPLNALNVPAQRRWKQHGILTIIGMLIRFPLVRLSPVAGAVLAQQNDWALFRRPFFLSGAGWWIAVLVAILALDLTKYATHRLYHTISWLWRLHRVHHSDPDFDVSTGARFHPLEPLLVEATDLAAIWVLAPPVGAVFAAVMIGVVVNFLEHANAELPESVERRLRLILITPALHRIHHSDKFEDQQHNFGETFPWWDHIFGTYAADSTNGANARVGLPGYREESVELGEMMLQPFRPEKGEAGATTAGDSGL
jgi:sterol desaturase/sphingolipid hydroxylase (fatty acid hydroxylase superfamily)